MKILGWIVAAVLAVLGLLFVAYKSRTPATTTAAGTAVATGTTAGTTSTQVNDTAQNITAIGGAVTSALTALQGLFK